MKPFCVDENRLLIGRCAASYSRSLLENVMMMRACFDKKTKKERGLAFRASSQKKKFLPTFMNGRSGLHSNQALLSVVFLLNLLLGTSNASAQAKNLLPPFSMTLSNGRYFTPAELPKEKPVLLIYFAPDCDHCHTLMNGFFKRVNEFKKVEVVMVTFTPVKEVSDFERSYQTTQYPNIRVGTEGQTNYLRLFYKLQSTPFVALFNRKGELVKSYRKDPSVDALIKALKAL